jgi:hypothetical protein
MNEILQINKNEINQLTFGVGGRDILSIFPTQTGFGVRIPDGITMDEAAAKFVYVLRDQIKNLKSLESTEGMS